MTEECNCLPLKQILSCPFKTCENTQFFQNFFGTGFTASETCWPALESAGVLGCKNVGQSSPALPCLETDISPLAGSCFPSTSFLPPGSLSQWNWGIPYPPQCSRMGCHPGTRVRSFPSDSPGPLGIYTVYSTAGLCKHGRGCPYFVQLCTMEMWLRAPRGGWRDFGVPPGDLRTTGSANGICTLSWAQGPGIAGAVWIYQAKRMSAFRCRNGDCGQDRGLPWLLQSDLGKLLCPCHTSFESFPCGKSAPKVRGWGCSPSRAEPLDQEWLGFPLQAVQLYQQLYL